MPAKLPPAAPEGAAVTVHVLPSVHVVPLTVVLGLVHVIAVAPPPCDVSRVPAEPAVVGRLKFQVPAAACGCTVTAPLVDPLKMRAAFTELRGSPSVTVFNQLLRHTLVALPRSVAFDAPG